MRTAAAATVIAVSPAAHALHAGQVNLQRPQQPVPIAQIAPKPAAASVTTTNQITVHATPGMDGMAVGRAVSAELDRRERERDSRRYSRLSDID